MVAGNQNARGAGLALSLAAALTAAGAGAALADCPPGYPANLPCPVSPAETVPQEHQDRVARLMRLGEGTQSFEFHTTAIGQEEHGLADYPVDLPVLRVVADRDVFFDTGSDRVRPEAEPLLDIIADSLMREPPDVTLFVAGHTDSRGDPDYNLDLGLRRAQAVAAALVRRGIYQAEVYRVSFGELVPLADNDTVLGRARNRRVEFLFGAQPQALVKLLERQEIQLCAQKVDDRMDDKCRIPISFDAQKVEVSTEHQAEIASIKRETEALKLDTSTSRADIERKREEIALRRERIPVVLDRTRIKITLTPDRLESD